MLSELSASLALAFSISLLLGLVLYVIGFVVAPRNKKKGDKLAPYACGEDLPAVKLQVNAEEFFVYATYFLIFDVVAFMLATSLGKPGFFPILFIGIVMAASLVLFSFQWVRTKWG